MADEIDSGNRSRLLAIAAQVAHPVKPKQGGLPQAVDLSLNLTVYVDGNTVIRLKEPGSHRRKAADWPGGWARAGGEEQAVAKFRQLWQTLRERAEREAGAGR